MEKNPKVSVIIPVYNVEQYIGRCLESVVGQTLWDIEIIVVNDGTKDNSISIVEKYMELDKRIKLVEKENGGLASARNAGLRVATGTLVMFLDSDDYLEEQACARIYEEYLHYYADIIVFGSKPFPEFSDSDEWISWNLTTRFRFYPEFKPRALFTEPGGNPFAWDRAFVRSFLIENNLWFREDVLFGEDLVFIFCVAPQARGIRFIPDILHNYQCVRSGSLMDSYNDEIEIKIQQHIRNSAIITQYWSEKGFLDQWKKEYFKWFRDFLVYDLQKYPLVNRKKYAKQVLFIIKKYNLSSKSLRDQRTIKKLIKLTR